MRILTGALELVVPSDRSQSQTPRRQPLPSTKSSRGAPHALRGGLASHLRASLWASARSEGTMRFLTHVLELVVPSDRAQTQRPRRKSARRCFATALACGAHTHLFHLLSLPASHPYPSHASRPQVADHVHDANEPADRAQACVRVGSLHAGQTDREGRGERRGERRGGAPGPCCVVCCGLFYYSRRGLPEHDG